MWRPNAVRVETVGCRYIQQCPLLLSCRDAGTDVLEHLTRAAVFGVDEGFSLGVSICGNVAGSMNCWGAVMVLGGVALSSR